MGNVLPATALGRRSSPASAAICIDSSTGVVCTCDSNLTGCAGCTPNCDGTTCGGNGCGGFCACAAGLLCSAGRCVTGTCTVCDGTTCGNVGCDGVCACAAGLTCSAGRCVAPPACTPNCDGKTCGDDGCGGSCGTCTKHGQSCNGAGQCVTPPACKPTTCHAQGIACGSIADGCGGTLQCGSCKKHGQSCNGAGQCV